MSPQIKQLLIVFLTILTITIAGCFDQPDEFVSPSWDVEVLVPLTTKEFSLKEMVEKDSSILQWSQDPSSLGLLYFSDTTDITTVNVKNQLRMDGFSTNFSQTLGPIKITVPLPAAADIRVEAWAPGVTAGSEVVFPEQEGAIQIGFNSLETIKSITLDEGNLKIYVYNKLPVKIVLRGVKIQNAVDQSIIAERPNTISNWITIQPLSLDSLEFDIAGKTILDSLEYLGTIWSPGSGGETVIVPEEAGTQILALFNNLVVASASAPLPSQSFAFSETVNISDSTKIESVVINKGGATLNINNNMDVALSASVTFNNLFDLNNNPYSLDISLQRNENNRVIDIPLNGWKIATETPGSPTGEISYSVSIVTESSDQISTISKNDSIAFALNFEDLVFESFTGLLKPTTIQLEDSHLKLDYGDFMKSFEFSEINFGEANFYLNLNTSADISILINTDVSATNGTITNKLAIRDVYLPTLEATKIDVSSLVNGFSSELPNDFSISGSAKINPNYEIGTIARSDSVYGDVIFEIPLNVGIAGGTIKDTIGINIGEINDEQINKVNYAEVTFFVSNSIPLGVTLNATVLDEYFNEVLSLPPSYNDIDTIRIPAPVVSDGGDIIQQGELTQTIRLYGEDVQKFLNNPNMFIEINFETPRDNNAPVKFKTSNKISFSVKGKASYKAEL